MVQTRGRGQKRKVHDSEKPTAKATSLQERPKKKPRATKTKTPAQTTRKHDKAKSSVKSKSRDIPSKKTVNESAATRDGSAKSTPTPPVEIRICGKAGAEPEKQQPRSDPQHNSSWTSSKVNTGQLIQALQFLIKEFQDLKVKLEGAESPSTDCMNNAFTLYSLCSSAFGVIKAEETGSDPSQSPTQEQNAYAVHEAAAEQCLQIWDEMHGETSSKDIWVALDSLGTEKRDVQHATVYDLGHAWIEFQQMHALECATDVDKHSSQPARVDGNEDEDHFQGSNPSAIGEQLPETQQHSRSKAADEALNAAINDGVEVDLEDLFADDY